MTRELGKQAPGSWIAATSSPGTLQITSQAPQFRVAPIPVQTLGGWIQLAEPGPHAQRPGSGMGGGPLALPRPTRGGVPQIIQGDSGGGGPKILTNVF